DALAKRIAADNLFLDTSAEVRGARFRELATIHGDCRNVGTIEPENALRGTWRMTCERGWLDVNITLAPTSRPRVQLINVQSTLPPDPEMAKAISSVAQMLNEWGAKGTTALVPAALDDAKVRRQMAAMPVWGTCKARETIAGDGTR